MKYKKVVKGEFISRPNRFIANCKIENTIHVCHVKNTGRCRELLVPGATVFLEESDNPQRKTKYDLIAVYKGDTLINMDSQAPNKVFYEWAKEYFKPDFIKPEYTYKNSRFDCYMEKNGEKIFIEVKGVTLENGGVASFPDAPTQRGIKHLLELVDAVQSGYTCYVFFIVQMKGIQYFEPNEERHREFAEALKFASENGVKVMCLDCIVTPDSLCADNFVEVRI